MEGKSANHWIYTHQSTYLETEYPRGYKVSSIIHKCEVMVTVVVFVVWKSFEVTVHIR